MDTLLHKDWDPILRRYSTIAEPSVQKFREAYYEYVPKKNMHVNDITADDLMKHLQRTSVEVATSTDEWPVHSLRLLPKPICEVLALLLNLVEDVGRWPRPLATSRSFRRERARSPQI